MRGLLIVRCCFAPSTRVERVGSGQWWKGVIGKRRRKKLTNKMGNDGVETQEGRLGAKQLEVVMIPVWAAATM
jgi:hypothetical protein